MMRIRYGAILYVQTRIPAARASPILSGSDAPAPRNVSTPKIERILAAVKPWKKGIPPAAERAMALAQCLDAEVLLVSTVYDSDVAFRVDRGDTAAAAAQRGFIAREERALERLAAALREWGVRVRTRVLWQRVVQDAILREIEEYDADLVVTGTHEPELRPHMRLTDTDWQLMRTCSVPLLIVNGAEAFECERILAAIDPLHAHEEPAGLDRSVLELARLLERSCDAELLVVNAYPEPERFAFASSVEVLPGVFYGAENIESLHRKAAVELITAYGITPAQLVLRPGNPVRVIADVVEEHRIDLVIAGALKRSRLEQALLGSTAEGVVLEARCDVLLVKPRS